MKVTKIEYTARDTNGKEIKRSITYANPDATDYVLKTATEQLLSLSDDTLTKIERVDTTDITNATNE